MRCSIYFSFRSQEISSHAQEEARASAKQLVAAQQRLATLKDAVAAAQRVAAAREAAAAAAIQRNAADTAAELRKQDVDKQISQSEQEAKVGIITTIFFYLIVIDIIDAITNIINTDNRFISSFFFFLIGKRHCCGKGKRRR